MSGWRDLRCGEPRPADEGQIVTLAGWAARRRDHGGLIFIDLRDETGVTQLVVNPENAPEAASTAHEVRNEYVLQATGPIVRRVPETVNPKMPTGEVEMQVETLRVLSSCPPLPFQLDEENVDEALRQKYRWIDLRRDDMQRNIRIRGQLTRIIREEMERESFVDIETPILWKPTPEGARDFLVPARLQKGKFYALPQSPQIAKQLLVISGFERYYQIARCFRDEDPRADRLQELTQLDVEMEEATETTRGSEFGVFAKARCVRYIAVPKEFSRTELQALEAQAKSWGAKGLAYIVFRADGEVSAPIAKFLDAEVLERWRAPGHTLLFVADEERIVAKVLGLLRLQLGRELELIDESRWEFRWIVDMAAAEYEEETGTWHAAHHPFTRPTDDTVEFLKSDPSRARAVAYDLVGNGLELAGGSFRIHEPKLQQQVFENLGIGPEEQREKFGFLLDALAMGAPPHGGIASGIDRLLMALLGEERIRDTQAFPKNQVGYDYMTGAPIGLTQEQLAELGIRLLEPPS